MSAEEWVMKEGRYNEMGRLMLQRYLLDLPTPLDGQSASQIIAGARQFAVEKGTPKDEASKLDITARMLTEVINSFSGEFGAPTVSVELGASKQKFYSIAARRVDRKKFLALLRHQNKIVVDSRTHARGEKAKEELACIRKQGGATGPGGKVNLLRYKGHEALLLRFFPSHLYILRFLCLTGYISGVGGGFEAPASITKAQSCVQDHPC